MNRVPTETAYACGSIPSRTNSCATKCYVAMAGDVNRAAQCPTLRSTTKNFAASPATIRSRTLSRFVLHATLVCIAI